MKLVIEPNLEDFKPENFQYHLPHTATYEVSFKAPRTGIYEIGVMKITLREGQRWQGKVKGPSQVRWLKPV
jgi:hypothetical protein